MSRKTWKLFIKQKKILDFFPDWKRSQMDKFKTVYIFNYRENIVSKGENAGNQHFLPYPQCFQKAYDSWSFELEIVTDRVKPI